MIKVSQYGNNSGTRKPQNSSTLTENRNKSIVDSSLSEKKKPGAKACMVLMYSKCGNCRGLTQCFHINDNYLSG